MLRRRLYGTYSRNEHPGKDQRLQTVMSTKQGKHGNVESGTEVPRSKLVRALRKYTDLHSTTALRGSQPAILEIRL
jgi:hypothetical protein